MILKHFFFPFFIWQLSDRRHDAKVFTRPKHIIYSSDSKAEQRLFICITVAAEVTGAPCAVSGESASALKGLVWWGNQGTEQVGDLAALVFRVIPTAGNSPWLCGFYLS